MKLICLNLWGGKLVEPLLEFVKRKGEEADIFCFQEALQTSGEAPALKSGARADIFDVLQKALPDFQGYFDKNEEGWDFGEPVSFPLAIGQASFVKKGLEVRTHEHIPIVETPSGRAEDPSDRPRALQHLEISAPGGEPFHTFNFHGLLDDGHKRDTEKRLNQLNRVRCIVEKAGNRAILCGDFNTRPETKGIAMFREKMSDLVDKFGMPQTRSHWYATRDKYEDYWGDYIFTTDGIKVNNFAVPKDINSDHMPLWLDFD